MDIKDYLRVIRRRWPIVLLITTLVLVSTVFLSPKPTFVYRSDAEVIVQEPPMISIVMRGAENSPQLAQETITASTNISLIRRREFLEYALYRIPNMARLFRLGETEEDIERNLPVKEQEELEAIVAIRDPEVRNSPKTREREKKLRADIADKKSKLTNTMNELKNMIAIEKEKDTQIVRISVTSDSEVKAVGVAAGVVEGFMLYSVEIPQRRIALMIDRLKEDQLEPAIRKRDGVARELAKVQVQLQPPAPGMPDTREAELRREAGELAQAAARLREEREALETKIADLRGELASGELSLDPGAPAFQSADALLNRMLELQRSIDADLFDKTDQHPEVIQKKREIRNLQTLLDRRREEDQVFEGIRAKQARIRLLVAQERALRGVRDAELRKARELAEVKERLEAARPAQPPDLETVARLREREAQLASEKAAAEDEVRETQSYINGLERSQKTFTPLVSKVSDARPAVPIPVGPQKSSLPFALAVGLGLGLGAAYFLEFITTTVRTEHDIRRYVNLPLVGMILKIREEDQRLLINVAPKSPLSEVFNTIGTVFESYGAEYGAKIFMVASSKAAEGKSTITANLAVAMARGGRRVILIDCDLRKAVQHRFFNVDNTQGLSTFIDAATRAEAGAPLPDLDALLKPTEVENLRLLPAGPHPQNPVGLIKSAPFKEMLSRLRDAADVILIDVPPINLAVDTMVMSTLVDAVVLLVSAGETSKDEVTYAKRIIETARGRMIGCILNKAGPESQGYYYYYYYYYDSYKYYRE
jgi:capsular exopolysaccharide synthesis family protein